MFTFLGKVSKELLQLKRQWASLVGSFQGKWNISKFMEFAYGLVFESTKTELDHYRPRAS